MWPADFISFLITPPGKIGAPAGTTVRLASRNRPALIVYRNFSSLPRPPGTSDDRQRPAVTGVLSRPGSVHRGRHIPNQRGGGVLAGDTASAGSAPLLSFQVASGTESDRLLFLIITGQAAGVNAAMGCEGNETFSNGSSEPHMRRVNESLSVCTCTVLSERDRWHQPCVPERDASRR